jgi:hypothetical protein
MPAKSAPQKDHLEEMIGPASNEAANIVATGNNMPGKQVYRAIAAIMAELGKQGIAKSRQSSGTGASFKFRGIDQVYEALNPLLAQHNLVILPRVTGRNVAERVSGKGNPLFYTVLTVDFDFVSAEDGSMHTITTVGEAMDSGDKSSSKCISIAYKYACFITFCIPVEEGVADDPDAETHEVAPRNQSAPQQSAPASKTNADEERRKQNEVIARAEFNRAEAMLRASLDEKSLDEVWNNKIDWTKIPKSWHPHMQKINADVLAEIRKPKAPAAVNSPNFDPSQPTGPAQLDDDIPF